MFDIGWSELVVIAVVALIAIGPKELPGVLRTVGQYMGKIRRMASEFQGQFQEAMREAEMADLKKQVDEMTERGVGPDELRSDGGRAEGNRRGHGRPAARVRHDRSRRAARRHRQRFARGRGAGRAGRSTRPRLPSRSRQRMQAAGHADVAVAPEAPQPKAGSGA